jgi:hypothetical protein
MVLCQVQVVGPRLADLAAVVMMRLELFVPSPMARVMWRSCSATTPGMRDPVIEATEPGEHQTAHGTGATPCKVMPVQEGSRAPVTTPHPVIARLAGLVMMVSIVILIVGNKPVIADFFGTNDEELRLQYLLDAPDDWDWAMTMYAVMGVVVAVGFALWAVAVHLGGAERTSRRIAGVGAISAALGALAWAFLCYGRATRPPAEVAAGDAEWSLLAWAPLVMVAVGLVGWMLLRADMRARGWVIIVAAVIFVPIGIILPLGVAFPVALTGLIILVTSPSRWRSNVTIASTDPGTQDRP